MLDPFCGSGTSLLEANLVGINALGADANPLARIISDVKTTKIDTDKATRLLETIKSLSVSQKLIYHNSRIRTFGFLLICNMI